MTERLKSWFLYLKNLKDENAQDLIEYGLAAALIAFGAVFGMETLANGLNNAFSLIASTLEVYLTSP